MNLACFSIISIFETDFFSFSARSFIVELKHLDFSLFLFIFRACCLIDDLDNGIDEEDEEEHQYENRYVREDDGGGITRSDITISYS